MIRVFALVIVTALGVAGQTASTPAPSAPVRRAAPAAKPAPPVPAPEQLKYPPLKPIEIPPVATFTLPNGLNLFLLEDHELPLVGGLALVRTGNLFDPPGKVGLATMTGMVMRTGGTKAKTGDQIDEELEDIAAHVESEIGETSGSVSFSALKENSGQVLAVFHDLLTAPAFRPDKIALAKTQLNSGIVRRNDEPRAIADREFAATVYGKDTPYGWDDQYDTIARITRQDLRGFYQRYFFPSNTMVAVWGDFQTGEMKDRLEKLFADWTVTQPPVPPFPKVEAKPAPGVYLAVKQDVAQTFFTVGQLGGELRDKDYPALEIMADILGGGFQSRLFKEIRTRMGNAYDIGASWGANYDHPGLFEISGSTKSPSTLETLQAIRQEVERMRTSEVSESELETARDTALNSLVFAFDTRSKTLGRVLAYEYFGYPKDFIQQYQAALAGVTRADVLRVARERLSPDRFSIVAVGNPDQFAKPLNSLGPMHSIDLTIPSPTKEPVQADANSVAAAGQLLERARKAVGGADKLAAVKDLTANVTFQFDAPAGGTQAAETYRWIAPTYYREDTRMQGRAISAYCDGKTAWVASGQNSGPPPPPLLQQLQDALSRVYFRTLRADHEPGWTVSAIDDTTVEVVVGERSYRMAFDPATGLMQSMSYDLPVAQGPPQTMEEDYSDFREIGGIKIPFRTVLLRGGQKFAETTVNDYKINSGIDIATLGKRP